MPDAAEPEFVGAGRRAVVEGLLRTYDLVRRTAWPQWVALEAPSGWGKTRIAREFYARLAAERQHDPPYWPPGIVESLTEGADTLSARRKRVFPHVEHVPGSLPAFMWWGIACSTRDGLPTVALAEDLDQLRAHAGYLEDAWRRTAPRGPRIGQSLRDLGVAAADELVMEGVGSAAEALLGAAVPGLGLVRWLGERTIATLRDAGARRDRLEASDAIIAKSDLVDDTVAMIARLATPDLPVVVFVEDLHDADASLSDLLAQLATRPGAVLIVTTSWPGSTTANPHVARALHTASDRLAVLDHRGGRPPALFPSDASLAPLAAEALAAIVRFRYPVVDDETLQRIVARYTNPLALELFCELPRIRRRVRDGVLTLSLGAIEESPSEIRGLYRELWQELPEPLREALSLAALGAPSTISPTAAGSGQWNAALLLRALESLDWPTLPDVAAALGTDADAYSWVREVSAMLRAFHEPDQLVVAAEDDTFLVAEDRVEVRTALALAIVEIAGGDDLPAEETVHLAEIAAVLAAEGFLSDRDALARAVLPAIDVLGDQPRETRRLLAFADAALVDDVDSPASRGVRRRRAVARLNLGDAAGAIDDSMHLLEHLAEDDPLRWTVRDDIGYALQEAGRHQDALEVFRASASDSEEQLGVDHPDTILRTRAVALQLTLLGRLDDALALSESVLAAGIRVFGEEHPETLIALNNLAVVLESLERLDEAIAANERLQEARSRVLGPGHLMTLATRGNLASALLRAGRIAEALAASRALVVDAERELGADHPDALSVRNLYGRCLLADGQVEAATGVHEGVWDDRRRALGDDHPDTLASRSCLAEDLIVAGRLDDALVHLDELLDDRQRILGVDHPDTLVTRGFCADAILRSGDAEAALAAYDALVADRERILGPRHIQSLIGRVGLADALAATGHARDACETLESLIADATGVLGSTSHLVVTARGNLAHHLLEVDPDLAADAAARLIADLDLLGTHEQDALSAHRTLVRALTAADGSAGALQAARECADRHVRVHGVAHRETLGAREDLVIALLDAGRADDAVPEMESIAATACDAYGPRSADGIGARALLAAVYAAAGRPADAVSVRRALRDEREEEGDDDDPALLAARDDLAFALLDAGEPDEALALLRRVLADSVRTLGSSHPDTIISAANIAIALDARGDHAGARAHRERALAEAIAALGDDHDVTVGIRAALDGDGPASDASE